MACAQDIFSHQVSEELYSCICEQQGEACIGRITKNFPEHWQKLWLMANRLVATPKSLTELGAFELLAVRNYLVLGLRVQQNKTIDPLMARMIAHGRHAGESAFSPEEGEAFRVWLIVAILTHISATRPQIVTQMEAPASDESLSITRLPWPESCTVVPTHPVDAVVRRQEGSHIPSAELGILEVAALILSRRVYDKGAPTRRTSRV